MDLSTEVTNIVCRNTIKYLHNVSDQVPDNFRILKSFYTSKFRILEERGNVYLPTNKNKSHARCPRCCLKFPETHSSYVVKSEAKKSKFTRKLLNKIKRKKVLTKFQAEYVKKLNVNGGNQLVIKCKFCQKEVTHNLTKPVKPVKCRRDVNANKKIVNNNKKRKKKKKKDKFCGLQKEAVNLAQARKGAVCENKNDNSTVISNKSVRRKRARVRKNNICKLNKMLNEPSNFQTIKSSLTQLLQSFG